MTADLNNLDDFDFGPELAKIADEVGTRKVDAIKAIAVEFSETVALDDAQRIQSTDDPRELAGNIISRIDHRIAKTSETSLLGDALDSIRREADLEETFRWWMTAYAKYDEIYGTGEEEDFLTALFEGRLDFVHA